MDNRFEKLKWNSSLALIYQVVLVISGLILPRCYLWFYGTEVNGLLSSITQFLSFINICDLGVSTVVASAYYKPLAHKDMFQISRIFVYARKFFRVISYILLAYVAVLLVVYPVVVAENFDFLFTFLLILAMSLSQFFQYFIGIPYQILLNADQRSYVQLLINGSALILSTLVSVLLMWIGCSIQMVKLVSALIYLLRPLLMMHYAKKRYPIDVTVKSTDDVIPQKWNGVVQHIAYTIYENTDVLVLTLFSTLTNVSVYTVYTMVTSGIRNLISAATTGFQALFGNMIARQEQEKLKDIFRLYDWLIHTISTVLFTITGLLIVPFVQMYTAGIHDAEYTAPVFAVLITVAFWLNSIRNGMFTLFRSAGHYKQIQKASLIEAAVNLVVSIVMVFRFGLVGVAIGTIAAAVFFVIFEVRYLSKNIIYRPVGQFLKQLVVDVVSVLLMTLAGIWLIPKKAGIVAWLQSALLVTVVCLLVTVLVQFLFQRQKIKMLLPALRKRSWEKLQGNPGGIFVEQIQTAVHVLIKNAVKNKPALLPEDTDWEQVLKIAQEAQIVPLIYAGIHPDQPVAEDTRKIFFATCYHQLLMSRAQQKACAEMEKAFQDAGLDYMPLKGAKLKDLYPRPELRTMGDLDILIRMEQYDKIRQIMLDLGYTEDKETDHEYIWTRKPFVVVELHKRLIPTYNTDYYRYFGDGWKLAEPTDRACCYAMRPENQWIYIFTHFAKHYRDGGIGIRHLADLWVYRRNYPDMDEAYICQELEQLHLLRFYQNMMDVLAVCFADGDANPITDRIISKIFNSRVYGIPENWDAANALRQTKQARNVRHARAKTLRQLIFMPCREMEKHYPVLKKWPVLLPVMWVVRWFRTIFYHRENIQRQKQRLDAMTVQTVTKYQSELDMVGLDFHFSEAEQQ